MVDFSRPINFSRPEAFLPTVEDSSRYEGKSHSGLFYSPLRKQKNEEEKEEKKQKSATNGLIDIVA